MQKIRGYLALTVILVTLLVCDPIQRLVIAPWVRLFPARRIPVFTAWQSFLARVVLRPLSAIGGAQIPPFASIPGRAGTLVIMNHQSVLDIPMVVGSVRGAYPRIVTRRRYFRWIPLISHMVRLYQYPIVDPRANQSESRRLLSELTAAAADSDVPIAIFPEGTRTRNGEIGRFKSRGLKAILEQRPWTVYVLVGDGFWERAKMKHFIAGMGAIQGKLEMFGPFEWSDPEQDPDAFIADIRDQMVERLAAMRSTVPA